MTEDIFQNTQDAWRPGAGRHGFLMFDGQHVADFSCWLGDPLPFHGLASASLVKQDLHFVAMDPTWIQNVVVLGRSPLSLVT